ncbi:MAG TPA: hypothetical protein VL049_22115, partial [Candidatus Dormibacteraeota bacterium]|nr:hypothetical protein [Candidatus Dormibacteraeota bacterium]
MSAVSWDETLFKGLYSAARGAFRGRGEAAGACRLTDHQARLQLLAGVLSGERLVVQAADHDGGWRGDVILLPPSLALAPTPEANLIAYLLRVAYACTSRQLGLTAEGDEIERALRTWLAVAAT